MPSYQNHNKELKPMTTEKIIKVWNIFFILVYLLIVIIIIVQLLAMFSSNDMKLADTDFWSLIISLLFGGTLHWLGNCVLTKIKKLEEKIYPEKKQEEK